MDDAINAAAKSHKASFPASGCSEACIKAQLEGYYKDELKCQKVDAVDMRGDEVKQVGGANRSE